MHRFRVVILCVVCLSLITILLQRNYIKEVVYGAITYSKISTNETFYSTKEIRSSIIRTGSQETNPRIPDDAYEFLYGPEFQQAIDKAAARSKKKILFWHPDGDHSMTFSTDLPRECGGCEVREDKSLINDKATEAVIILFDYSVPHLMPKTKRNLDQYWIWRCAEAPPYMSRANWLSIADQIGFNMTMTYRFNSDIRLVYGNSASQTGNKLENPLAGKKDLALIAVSNCGLTPAAVLRLQYLKELVRRGLRLTTMGRCFQGETVPRNNIDEMTKFTSQFKFYLAFENSYHCKDYVTEKFFRALKAGVVPVVWGSTRAVYEAHIPSSGFIFVEDFPSMQSLIDYLNYLDKNDTAYLEYFRWRTEREHIPEYKMETSVCQICRFLHGINVDDAYKSDYRNISKKLSDYIRDRPPRKTFPAIKDWWNNGDSPECLSRNVKIDENGRIVVTL